MKKLVPLAVLSLVVSALAATPLASASGGDPEVIKEGSCSAASDWKLKAKIDDGLIEAEFEVDENIVGRQWRVTFLRDGVVVFRGTRTTKAPSGSFEVERLLANPPGPNRIVAKARELTTGETCRGAVTI